MGKLNLAKLDCGLDENQTVMVRDKNNNISVEIGVYQTPVGFGWDQ